ncbi:uncharacterized protein LOC109727701, partial [Ananas comosus]|uniref:Uncharacterized protein LOC109727701 n=1 Tax=Ananas comosus TaxID=4615 RepID=A0A6P5HE98_ANACO
SKRQRRPSVRLGEIGDQPAAISSEPSFRRHPKLWNPDEPIIPRHKPPRPHHPSKPSSRTRALTTLAPPGDDDDRLDLPSQPPPDDHDENLDPDGEIRHGARGPKPWRSVGGGGARRARSGWAAPRADEAAASAEEGPDEERYGVEGDDDSPIDRRLSAARVRVLESRDAGPAAEGDSPYEMDGRDWIDRNGWCPSVEDGSVNSWLDGLGLGRYAPLFEIHEVDEEVLPLLTLEDLKDMGINAVGARRKMYSAIQKLRKKKP